jgi:subtilisin-like proprotein convertase family protein
MGKLHKLAGLFFILGFFLPKLCAAAVLDTVGVDYGTPGDAFANALLPGQTGAVFFSFKNSSNENLREIDFQVNPGVCISGAESNLRIPLIAPGETVRLDRGLEIGIDRTCARGSEAQILFFGDYQTERGELGRVWSEAKFSIAPIPEVSFLQENIGLRIPDRATVNYRFTIPLDIPIAQIGLFLALDHSYLSDLRIHIIHPSGQGVELPNRSGDGSNLEIRYGLGGTPLPQFSAFRNLRSLGNWEVRIQDTASGDAGVLNKVGLRILPN